MVLVVVAGVLVALIRGLNQGSPASHDVAGPGTGPSAGAPGQLTGPGGTAGPSAGPNASPGASATAGPGATPGASAGPSAKHPGGGPTGSGPRPSSSGPGQQPPTPTLAGWPDASNTGVPSGTALATVSGDLTIKTSGTVVSGKDIHGCVNVQANNVTIKNSRITCPGAYGIRGFNGGTDYTGLKIQDSELDGQNSGFSGVGYSNFTALRLNIHGFENGFALGANVTIQDTYVHDLKLADGGHPDDIQTVDGGDNYVIEHNTLIAPVTNSAIALCCTSGDMVSNVLIDNNYLAGGGWTLYCPRQSTPGVRITNNKFGPANFGPAASCGPPGVAEFTGNVYASNGKPVPD